MKKIVYLNFIGLLVYAISAGQMGPPCLTTSPIARILESHSKLKQVVSKASAYYEYSTEKPAIINRIIRGAFVHRALINKDAALRTTLCLYERYEENIRALIWFYYALALEKGQSFSDGTFSIQDTTGEVYAYLRNNPAAYGRISTHFTQYLKSSSLSAEDKKQFGLNISGLPDNKKTLLFGKISADQGLFFIKPESDGVKHIAETVKHGFSLVRAQLRKIAPAVQTKALVYYKGAKTPRIAAFSRLLSGCFGTDDAPTSRKERVPLDERIKFGKLLYALRKYTAMSDAAIAGHISKASIYGISYMYQEAQMLLEACIYASILITPFIKELERRYDYLNLRFGREVILTSHDFLYERKI